MGLGFSKRWVPFHKTTRIFFEGFSHTSFFALGSDSAPGSEFALGFGAAFLFVLSRCFVRSESVFCSFRFCFSLVLAAFLLVFPLFVVKLHGSFI